MLMIHQGIVVLKKRARSPDLYVIHLMNGPVGFLRSCKSQETGALTCACLCIDKNLAGYNLAKALLHTAESGRSCLRTMTK